MTDNAKLPKPVEDAIAQLGEWESYNRKRGCHAYESDAANALEALAAWAREITRQRDAFMQRAIDLEKENRRLRGEVPPDTLAAYRRVLEACCAALDLGGVSAGKLAELIGATIGGLHSAGLQRVANALYDACQQ